MSKQRSEGHLGPGTRYTPGPWTLEREVWVNKLGMGDDHACQEIHHNGATLGYWVDCEWSGWSPNARLIAAAPELLEAAEIAEVQLAAGPESIGSTRTLVLLRAAIAKATA